MSKFKNIILRILFVSSISASVSSSSSASSSSSSTSSSMRRIFSSSVSSSRVAFVSNSDGNSYNIKPLLASKVGMSATFLTSNFHQHQHQHQHLKLSFPKISTSTTATTTTTTSLNLVESSNQSEESVSEELAMENIYTEWTIEDDKMLLKLLNMHTDDNNKKIQIHKIASMLGRGLNGVIQRKKKLTNVNSQAYQRLFNNGDNINDNNNNNDENNDENKKLVPVKEVLRRIKWDISLNPNDFQIKYYDRVTDSIHTCNFNQPNDSVKGKEENFVFAIPEHRIKSIIYIKDYGNHNSNDNDNDNDEGLNRERTVWDKDTRLDYIFGSMNGNGKTIYDIMEEYDDWLNEEKERIEYQKKRSKEIMLMIRSILGDTLFTSLKHLSKELQDGYHANGNTIHDQDVKLYVKTALSLFRKGYKDVPADSTSMGTLEEEDSPMKPLSASIPSTVKDIQSLNLFSDLVALLPDEELRERILLYIYQLITKLEKESNLSTIDTNTTNQKKQKNKNKNNQPLQEINEDEITETFVRGSGSGGQKINKTANKVVLVHHETQLRVECQDTRSLQQNRKIARKRMQLKLDTFYNGISSRTEMKVAKKINKKAKNKARNRARLRKKKKEADSSSSPNDE